MSDFWKLKNVFITGGTGFLGYWLTDYLLQSGANVVALVRDSVPGASFHRLGLRDRVTVVRGEVEDYFLLERILNEYEIDSVFHLAAQTIVTIANRNPMATFEANIRGTWNLLEACRRNRALVKRVVLASSDKAYGPQKKLPYEEDTPLRGTHPYDVSKTCADLIAYTFFNTYGLPVCVTRCGNFYGGGDLNFNRIFPGTIRAVLHGEPVIIRSDGSPIRDYIFIKDAVKAYTALAEKIEPLSLGGEAFNFSSGNLLSVLDLTNKILQVMGKEDHPVEVLNEATGEIQDQYLSIEKAKKILGWSPTYSLEESIRDSVDWYKEFFGSR